MGTEGKWETHTILAAVRQLRKPQRFVRRIIIHTNEGPEAWGGDNAVDLANWQSRPGNTVGGYHGITDEENRVRGAYDHEKVNGARGDNDETFHICIIGRAIQSRVQWLDPFSKAAGLQAAIIAAEVVKEYGIPLIRLTVEEFRANAKGFGGHVDVRDAFGETDHWDPGSNFPWDVFLGVVNELVTPEDDDMPQPTDVVDALEDPTTGGYWLLQSDGGIRAEKGAKFHGSYPGLKPQFRRGVRRFVTITARSDGKPGYVLYANDRARYVFPAPDLMM